MQLLHQQALTAHRVEHLQQQRAQQFFGWNRGPTDLRSTADQGAATADRRSPQSSGGSSAADDPLESVPRAKITEHGGRLSVISSHSHAPFLNVGSIVVRMDHAVDPMGSLFSILLENDTNSRSGRTAPSGEPVDHDRSLLSPRDNWPFGPPRPNCGTLRPADHPLRRIRALTDCRAGTPLAGFREAVLGHWATVDFAGAIVAGAPAAGAVHGP